MLPEEAIEIIEYARAFNKKNTRLMSALDEAVELFKKEQMKEEHQDVSEEYCEGWMDAYSEIMAKPRCFGLKKVEVEEAHGRWKVYETETYLGPSKSGKDRYVVNKTFYCDRCGKGTAIKSRFCAHCGAKMDGGQDGCI